MSEEPYAERDDYSPAEWRTRISAARLKVTLDRKLGRPTPPWIQKLAEEPRGEPERPRRPGSAA